MYDKLDFLYQQIKEKKISQQEAIEQIKELKLQTRKKSCHLVDSGSRQGITPQLSENESLLELVEKDVVRIVSEFLKVRDEDIDVHMELDEYGFDQVKLAVLANIFNEEYQLDLRPDEYFKTPTLHLLAEYLIAGYKDIFLKLSSFRVSQSASTVKENAIAAINHDSLLEKVMRYFKNALSSILKLPVNRIEADTPFEKYGIDSIMVMQLTNELEKTFGSLSKTLFFEYQTIGELSGYFLEAYREPLLTLLSIEEKTARPIENKFIAATEPVMHRSSRRRRRRSAFSAAAGQAAASKDIAIIGAAGRYPQARNLAEYWNNLKEGKDCITEIPKERWDHSLYFDADKHKPGKTYSKWGGFMDGVDQFDPLFFNISPREAEYMDPQERLFLQCVYETIEDAGYTRETLANYQGLGLEGNVGVFVGVMYEEYQLYGAQEQERGRMITLGGNPSSIANRISYFCNLHGPSMAVDTMCSSSLTAIHMACKSLQQGGCELAIAGGVNVSIHPNKYLGLAQGKFASSKGRCESFGEGGDGYVPGEGVGAILLKPLAKAVADGDHIYGVIKGTAINHGGKTNGYSVPNPNAQAGVIEQALKESGLDARGISYLEAHGTGTSLGDPIEITGLSKAFQKQTKDTQFCAIGSAKSNIGHCESAAGIAGVTKVLLQMKHGQLAPSLHSEVLNPYIDFSQTPFAVQQNLMEWKRPIVEMDGKVKEYPRIAGISAFGAGGSNAHIIISEYLRQDQALLPAGVTSQNPVLMVLSAKNEVCLKKQAGQLLTYIKGLQAAESDLINIAYTLQVGREAMEERLGFIAGSLKEVEETLQEFVEGRDSLAIYRGQVKKNKDAMAVFAVDKELQGVIRTWMECRNYTKLIDLWAKGLTLNWHQLYGDSKPQRISLPTYPFVRERYWVPQEGVQASIGIREAALNKLHPLVHQNVSSLAEQQFTSAFTGQEFFLENHVIQGHRIMPGVAYLEMARAAVELAIDGDTKKVLAAGQRQIGLKNVVWVRPLRVESQPVSLQIELYPEENGEIAYEIFREVNGEEIVYSQGSAILSHVEEIPPLDLETLRLRCSQKGLTSQQLYEIFHTMGMEYGPGHQGIEEIYVGQNQVLAKLSLPSSVAATQDYFVLHPSLLDAALQASLGFMSRERESSAAAKPSLPFALQELEILGNCTAVMWASLRYNADCKMGDKIRKLDIDLCDEHGKICVRMKRLSSRIMEDQAGKAEVASLHETLMLAPVWEEKEVNEQGESEFAAPSYEQHLVILCEPDEVTAEAIKIQFNELAHTGRCVSLQSKRKANDKRFQDYAGQLFEEIQNILKEKPKGKILIQVVVSDAKEQHLFAGLSGLLKTAGLENPKLVGQLIETECHENINGMIAKLKENSRFPKDSWIRYQKGKRQVVHLCEVETSQADIPWRDEGIYMITGGAGGLGLLFAKEIADTVKNTTLILTGRSPLDEVKQIKLRDIARMGANIQYEQVDVVDQEAVISLMKKIQEQYGSLHGIIHSAGIIQDNYFIKKTQKELQEVLAPKVTGLVNLDEATQNINLDFFILFSSMAGSCGNPGQADYAAANAFMDAYAKYRNELVESSERRGRTLAINWPLWKEGGMHVDEAVEKMMWQNTGMIAMQTQSGIQALYQAWASGKSQVMVAQGDRKRLHAEFLQQQAKQELVKIPINIDEKKKLPTSDSLQIKAIHYFKNEFSSIIKLPVSRIEADAPFENYGIDSVMVILLITELEKSFGSLSKTLFYEYQNIEELTGYFLESHQEALIKVLGIGERVTAEVENKIEIMPMAHSRSKRSRFPLCVPSPETKTKASLDIAIIGVAGRYPQAKNVQEFWQNLKDGKDCITEIPKERWEHGIYFDTDKNKSGKIYSKWGGFIDGVDQFDPLFFNISPREAEYMDPQERLFLQCVYETIEDAGYTRDTLTKNQGADIEGNVGVFVGVLYEEYQLYGVQKQAQGEMLAIPGSISSIANRISYFCNFHGPSVALDTMCSSSSTAIHFACQSLQQGSCELAIAGGVNLSIHPNKYLMLSQWNFLSSKGRCESFGKGGDGYVPGEGVGAILLKPLAKAIADGDHIYGVIKGTAINHGGKTNGYSVPNPNAQAGVIEQSLKEAGMDARAISYLEAHGTGTSLGDPIEITGLSKAFQKYTADTQFCAIGSAKSNIGHCESAAGIAGITKVLLQMKYGQLVPSLHSKIVNPYIDFSQTPFAVQQTLTEWKRPIIEMDGKKQEYPRAAGISSFGAGGSNAHIIIEEYIAKHPETLSVDVSTPNPVLIVLSARNEKHLKEQAKQLLSYIQENKFAESDLRDMAYTLQVGREAMEERLGFMADSINELEARLQGFVEGQETFEIYRGQVKKNKDTLTVFTADEELQEAVTKWIQRRKYPKLADLWVKGLVIDWQQLYSNGTPQRISLPTYPFSQESYWLPSTEGLSHLNSVSDRASTVIPALHPLLHRNTSNFSEQSFTSVFTEREFFLTKDIYGQRVLMKAAYLEMARAAIFEAAAIEDDRWTGLQMKNIEWENSIIVEELPAKVHISLYQENEEIDYEIYGEADDQEIIYGQGSAALTAVTETPALDLEKTQSQCNQRRITPQELYEAYKLMGMEYGPGQQGIEEIYVGTGQVLAKLSLPLSVIETQHDFVLHPSMMDAALQASLGLMNIEKGRKTAIPSSVPFALEGLEIFGKCTSVMWAFLRYSEGSQAGDKVQKLDIDLCDESGKICVLMKGLSSRVWEEPMETGEVKAANETLLLTSVWEEKAVKEQGGEKFTKAVYEQHLVILCEPGEVSPEEIQAQINGIAHTCRCISLQSEQQGIDKRFEAYASQVLEEIQHILQAKPKNKILIQIVAAGQKEQHLFAGLSGLLKTAGLENPNLIGQLIETELNETIDEIICRLKENSQCPADAQIRYEEGKRMVAGLRELEALPEDIPWRDGGIYLITGGAGGLGLLFAQEIADKVKDATLILTGRSSLDEFRQRKLREVERMGAKIQYEQVDVSDKEAVKDLVKKIQEKYDSLHGIIHSAGIIRDSYLLKKTKTQLQEVLAPKVTGLVNLDEASQEVNLDFFILFSSIAGISGSTGQADYAAANAFMDAYAAYRSELVDGRQRWGKTVAMNWPLWKEGGMQVDESVERMMWQSMGMTAMQTKSGIRALYQAIVSGKYQVSVVQGDRRRLQESFLLSHEKEDWATTLINIKEKKVVPVMDYDLFSRKAIHYFKTVLSSILKLPVHRIEDDTSFEKYGIDSIMVMELTNELEKSFGMLSKTLFYEYQTIEELTNYFLEFYREQLIELLGMEEKAAITTEDKLTPLNKVLQSAREKHKRFTSRSAASQGERVNRDVAIIGISGRYPQAQNLDEYWNNLKSGKDCITEIPKKRWDHKLYFDIEKNKQGKTYSKWGGFLEGVDEFDPIFFNISPREAEYMDPQERLFLQCAYETIEDAGYTREMLGKNLETGWEGKVGVFVGVTYQEYELYGTEKQAQDRIITIPGNISSIANRISYFCNFRGPSVALDTMCSSSLTAIHFACQSLQSSSCELAIAGGVNLSIHPNKYLMLSQWNFLSDKGRCESFGKGGDGYVPGEGVGALLLKPLEKAIADGDHIYGVIKGTAINHGGKTNGYTVPNPNAQADVIEQTLKETGIDPRMISYLEAHGTGTSLGDPIEITGLSKAFQKYTKDNQFCAIGSVKSNIGHCESAAGIAGVTKVLLQMKHRQLVPSLHSEVLNPYIDFSHTPFLVQQTLTEWKRPIVELNGKRKEYPRVAGISSFGAGGSNAHIVIEEYIAPTTESIPAAALQNPVLIVLSGKNEERLKAQANQLLAYIRESQLAELDLKNIAYTLQVGREAMEERLGFMAASVKEVEEKLQSFVQDQESPELYRGQVKKNKETLTIFTADEELQEAIAKWIQRRKYTKLADLWVKGLQVNWNQLYGDSKPQRISLPTYPFARESYWILAKDEMVQNKNSSYKADKTRDVLHPLLHQNISSFSEQGYSSIFMGQEFFLTNHIMQGCQVLPGVAYLEMARAAVEFAVDKETKKDLATWQRQIELKNVAWDRPLRIGGKPVQVQIELHTQENGEIVYKIYEEIGNEEIVYAQGSATLSVKTEKLTLDLEKIQSQCSQRRVNSRELYENYTIMGMEYGPDQRGIVEIYAGTEQVLAKLSLPVSVANTQGDFVLHPIIMDAALQAANGFNEGKKGRQFIYKPSLPLALHELKILGTCSSVMWAFIQFSEEPQAGDTVHKFDIDLCNQSGEICVQMVGVSLALLDGEALTYHSSEEIVTIYPEEPHINVQNFNNRLHAALKNKKVILTSNAIKRMDNKILLEKILLSLKKILSEVLKVQIKNIDADIEFNEYGFDLIKQHEFINTINQEFSITLKPATILNSQTLNSFTLHLVKDYEDLLTAYCESIEINELK